MTMGSRVRRLLRGFRMDDSSQDARPFLDRRDAGQRLAGHLQHYAGRPGVVVLGLPRGGVVVAAAVAAALGAPLEAFAVRKLGVPGHRELAMGAIASGGARVFNHQLIVDLGITPAEVAAIVAEEEQELGRRDQLYRHGRPALVLDGRVVILVDDGLATGATMRAAVQAVRALGPARIVVAVPVGSDEACRQLAQDADEVVCARIPRGFVAVGQHYVNFGDTPDAEVARLLHTGDTGRSPANNQR